MTKARIHVVVLVLAFLAFVGLTFANLRAGHRGGSRTDAEDAARSSPPAVSTSAAPPPAQEPSVEPAPLDAVLEVRVHSSVGEYQLVLIEPGVFEMGSASSVPGRDPDEALHPVEITRPFYLGVTEVPQHLWSEVMGTFPSRFQGPDRPVEGIPWLDAIRFANRMSKRDGLEPAYIVSGTGVRWNKDADGYRLPTEAEWEYAAGGRGTQTLYAGSSNIGEVGWYEGNAGGRTHDVATRRPNSLGLHDMTGNVWEWVWDWYGPYPNQAVTDPENPMAKPERCMRGGDWKDTAAHNRVANRGYIKPDNLRFAAGRVGFRLARYAD